MEKDRLSDRAEDAKPSPVGKDELNLAEFPIALLTEKAPQGVRTLEFKDQIFDKKENKLVNRKLTISSPPVSLRRSAASGVPVS